MPDIKDYIDIVGKDKIGDLYFLADKLQNKSILNINSTAVGGGVAEILSRMVPLLKQLGVNARWDVIKGDEKFFNITKKMHNALHGINTKLIKEDFDYFIEVNRRNSEEMNLSSDIFFIHDPQPIALIEKRKKAKTMGLALPY